MFKVFAFLKRNTELLSHDEYRAGHIGYHCCNSRRLKNIRGYLVNIWSNETLKKKMGQSYSFISYNEPEGFLDLWDGFPEVYFDNRKNWISAATPEPNRATKDGLSIDESWSLADGPFLFDRVEKNSQQFKSNHLRVIEKEITPVIRPEKKIIKIIQFFELKDEFKQNNSDKNAIEKFISLLKNIEGLHGLTQNLQDSDIDSAVKDFYPKDSWCFSEEGKNERQIFFNLWDGATEIYINKHENFVRGILNLQENNEFKTLQEKLFKSIWYVEVDENLIVLPNREPLPNYYYR